MYENDMDCCMGREDHFHYRKELFLAALSMPTKKDEMIN